MIKLLKKDILYFDDTSQKLNILQSVG